MPNSFDPRPNPFITEPFKWIGYGRQGESGPAIDGRSFGRDILQSFRFFGAWDRQADPYIVNLW